MHNYNLLSSERAMDFLKEELPANLIQAQRDFLEQIPIVEAIGKVYSTLYVKHNNEFSMLLLELTIRHQVVIIHILV